ncbi:MAG: class I SAM-dependent methyltransferase [Alphaproteobacteria bacterium]|jgi:2-polyprenyl-3-methyl-5-hydroxy-6-metoxy-1,4-benzoquinol methylase|nr:class I SAM-dependent methyltransferase [Alphaproteobacteria bacterium]
MVTQPPISDKILPALKAPGAGNDTDLELIDGGLQCVQTGETFMDANGVPSLFAPTDPNADQTDVTTRIKSFYEEYPFPNYDGLQEFGDLVNLGYSSQFSKDLLRAIGSKKLILECGCGTGQLSHFLQLNNNQVLGIDMSLGSLGLAVEHKQRNQLARSSFAQMNIFSLAVKDESMDVVISHGVLHHTFDARRAFMQIIKKVKPGGIVVVGLYNSISRIPTWVRSKFINVLGSNIDYVVRNHFRDARKADIWVKDQYFNPHETWHSIDEVMDWFKEGGIEYRNCRPAIMGTNGEDLPGMFDKSLPGSKYQRIVTQLSWLTSIAREGTLFDVIGRKPE